MSQLSIIVAVADNRVIGFNNTLPWHLPDDLKRFKALTMGHHIIMGRKTYESLGRLLPGRTTVIVTRNPHYTVDGAVVVNSLEDALEASQNDSEVFLIGGAELYTLGLSFADRLYITEIHAEYAGDAFFPTIDYSSWHETSREQHTSGNNISYSYVVYDRVPNLQVSNC